MRKIAANYIITNAGQKLKDSYLEISDEGVITNIVDTKGALREVAGLEFYNGVLVPGFVNAHTHLELAYLKGQIPTQGGLPNFIQSVRELRLKTSQTERLEAIRQADLEMQREGVVLVGDIANGTESIPTKTQSPIHYHTFVEVFGLDKYKADTMFSMALSVQKEFEKAQLSANITPHATYSVSSKLFELITNWAYSHNGIISIHNQETESENDMFRNKSGALVKGFQNQNIDLDNWHPTGQNALISALVQLPKCLKTNLVHNTFTSQEDIDKALIYSKFLYWTLCPHANKYIENQLPDIPLLAKNKLNICLGTDSLASNHQLSILEEMKLIQEHYPEVPFETLIQWSSLNGAEMLDMQKRFGSFEIGKTPGVLLIENFNFEDFQLKTDSTVRRLV